MSWKLKLTDTWRSIPGIREKPDKTVDTHTHAHTHIYTHALVTQDLLSPWGVWPREISLGPRHRPQSLTLAAFSWAGQDLGPWSQPRVPSHSRQASSPSLWNHRQISRELMTASLPGRQSFLLLLSTTPGRRGGEGLSRLTSRGQTARTKHSRRTRRQHDDSLVPTKRSAAFNIAT